MTEPTLTDLREIAQTIEAGWPEVEPPRLRQLANAFLTLTDPTPLTAEHCREAGLDAHEIDEYHTVWRVSPYEELAIYETQNAEHDFDMSCPRATVGQLRLALLQENRDGE